MLDLEGLWTRLEDPSVALNELASLKGSVGVKRLQELYSTPVDPDLMRERVGQLRDAGITVAGALSPQAAATHHDAVIKAGGEPVCVSAIADRTGGKVTFGDVPFVPATEVVMQSYAADECPLCKQGVPLKVT